LTDKRLFEQKAGPHVRVPRIFGLARAGRIEWVDPDAAATGDVVALARKLGRLVVKPLRGFRGIGVRVVRAEGEQLTVNRRSVDAATLRRFDPRFEWMVCEHLDQGRYAAGLFEKSVNTVRVVTLIDPESERPFVAGAVQRMGVAASEPVDNNQAGGISAAVDLETGRLSRAVRCAADGRPVWFDAHPDSGARFEELAVPRWQQVRDEVLHLAAHFPRNPFVGWDVALLDEGIAVIEGNHNPGMEVMQVHGPFLRNARIRRFFEHHGVLPARGTR
jgi:hypothetical protein